MKTVEEKSKFRRKFHGWLVLSGMVINFIVIGTIFYVAWTQDPDAKPPASFQNSRYSHFAPQKD